MVDLWEFESKMDRVEGLFSNGIRGDGKSCHRESYGTVMNMPKMVEFLKSEKDKYSTEDWNYLKGQFEGIGYLSPMNALTAKFIQWVIFEGMKSW